MLHILLTILKIIAIVLFVILGLVLLLLLSVLFLPIRYRGTGFYHGSPEGSLRVTWICRIISVKAHYKEQLEVVVRLFGIRVFRQNFFGEEEIADEPIPDLEDGIETNIVPSAEDALQLSVQELYSEASEHDSYVQPEEKTVEKSKKKSYGWLGKQKKKIISLMHGIKTKLLMSWKKCKDGKSYYDKAMEFSHDKSNQKTLCLLKRQLFRILRHLIPRRIKGAVTFGMEDPYTMGQITGAAAFLYPFLKDRVTFTPVFGEKVIDGELTLKGRIRIGTLLFFAGRMLLDRNFRKLLKRVLNRGGKKDGR